MEQRTYADLMERVLEGQDTRYSAEWIAANPPKPRTLERAEQFADASWGRPAKTAAEFELRWKPFAAEESASLLRIVDKFASVKASTLSTYLSSRVGYEQFCAAMQPPLVPYPLLARHVGAWLLARWKKWRKSNLSNTKPLISALTHHTVHTLCMDVNVRPYPGMGHLERHQVGRVCIALAELEDMALRRSIPLTLHVLRLAVQEKIAAVPPAELPAGDWSPSQAVAVRNVAMYGLARVCMLRKDDMTKGKLRLATYRSDRGKQDSNSGRLLVAPGKSHRTDVWAEVPGVPQTDLRGDWTDWMLPGVAMERWLKYYRRAAHCELAPGDPLFPDLDAAGRPRSTHFEPTELLGAVRSWATQLDFPEHFIERLTVHGFRSGGCSDAINSGKMDKEKIQKQGRWSGATYDMYIHLAASVVRDSLRDSVMSAMRTPAELRENASVADSRVAAYLSDLLPL